MSLYVKALFYSIILFSRKCLVWRFNKLLFVFASINTNKLSVVLIFDKDSIFGKLPCLPMGICFGSLCSLYVFNDGLPGKGKSFSLSNFFLEDVNWV